MAPPIVPSLKVPFHKTLGITSVDPAQGDASALTIEISAPHHNTRKVAHGGVLMTLLDAAVCRAARNADPEKRPVATVELKTTFMQPGAGRLVAKGACLHRTPSMAFCEAEVRDGDDRLIARGSATLRYLRTA